MTCGTTSTRVRWYVASCALAFSCLLSARPAAAVEHPGSIPKESQCSSCHADKVSGTSVHSAMGTLCTVCHVAQTQGDMTVLNLSMSKAQICFACHEKTAQMMRHMSSSKDASEKDTCLKCHDAHSSNRRMLLITDATAPALQ